MNMTVIWDVASCGLAEIGRDIKAMMEAASTSEMFVNFHETT
jgi:hypothetical protein